MSIEVIAVRLTKGMDLKLSLAKLVEQHGIKAGSIASCVGCISDLSVREQNLDSRHVAQEDHSLIRLQGWRKCRSSVIQFM